MEIIPKSTIYLCNNVMLDPDFKYTIDFYNKTDQYNYFVGKRDISFLENEEYTFIRNNEIKVKANIEQLFGDNYLFFNNGNKTYYAFITKKDYVNVDVTKITYKIDPMQSFMFDYQLNESFIDREHQDRFIRDTDPQYLKPIYNIVPENLEAGTDYDIIAKEKIKDNINDKDNLVWIEITATEPTTKGAGYSNTDPSTFKNLCNPLYQKGINTHIYCYLTPTLLNEDKPIYTPNGEGNLVRLDLLPLDHLVYNSTAVLSIRVLSYCPIKYDIVEYNGGYKITFAGGYQEGSTLSHDNTYMRVVDANNSNFGGVDLSKTGGWFLNLNYINDKNINDTMFTNIKREKLENKININNFKNYDYETKLRTYPYQYMQICDYQSTPLKVKYENITDNIHNIKIVQNIGVLAKTKVYVDKYNNDSGKEYNTTNTTISELPLLNEAYINYMSQNKASATSGVALNVASGLATLGIGIATGGIGLAVAGSQALGIGANIANNLIKIQDLKDTPDSIRQAGNNGTFDILDNNFKYNLSVFRIKPTYLNNIFNYLYHYGYKCNDFKIPDTKSRYYFNYIKTIGANIESNIDSEMLNEIINIYDNGITIWHYRSKETFKGVNNYYYENAEMKLIIKGDNNNV